MARRTWWRREAAETFAEQRVGGHHVVERGQLEGAARLKSDAEVLGVAVRRAEHPEEQLRLEEGAPVGFPAARAIEDLEDRGRCRVRRRPRI